MGLHKTRMKVAMEVTQGVRIIKNGPGWICRARGVDFNSEMVSNVARAHQVASGFDFKIWAHTLYTETV